MFKQYTPEEGALPNVVYIENENNICWYEYQKSFKTDTVKVAYDERGVVRSFSQDASKLWPINLYVTEFKKIPADVSIDGSWKVAGNKIIPYEDLVAKKQKALQEVNALAFECFIHGVEWPNEWKEYVKALKAAQDGEDIPEAPVNKPEGI